jgi:hypothetical protein
MTNRNLAFLGAALLLVGLFTPIVTFPLVGSVNLFNNGSNVIAIMVMGLAAVSAALVAKERLGDVIWPGIAASGLLLYVFVRLQYVLSQMRENVRTELQGNPFAGIAQSALGSIQLQWGWLVLAAGAGLVVYLGFQARKAEGAALLSMSDNTARAVAGLSLVLLLLAPLWDLVVKPGTEEPRLTGTGPAAPPGSTSSTAATDDARALTSEKTAYINQHLRLYELDARYYDSILDGRIPGVRFKIKNDGNRTLNRVTVRVVFYDARGNAISEQEYNPVLVSAYNVGSDNTPLRPNYIWQQERDRFFSAHNVPTEWATGRATATITDIEFGPNQ